MTTPIETLLQKFAPDELVTLFIVDTTVLGDTNGPYAITPMTDKDNNQPVMFDGVTYYPVPVEASGFEVSGQGAPPQPTMTVSNVDSIFTQVAIAYNNLVGATVTRLRTFGRYLDNGSEPDPTAYLPTDVFVVERMVERTDDRLVLQLAAAMDQEGRMWPGRMIIRDYCQWRYRFYKDGVFDYSHVYCPYQGTSYFTADGTPTSLASQDVCGKRMSDCKKRFGENGQLPFGAFPSVGLTRTV